MPTLTPNPYQGSGVKRADGCITGVGGPSVKQIVSRRSQARAADFSAGAGHRLWAAPNP